MEYEDRLTVATAEGVHLDLVMAGIGSRFIALFLDSIIQFLAILALFWVLSGLGNFGAALYYLVAFFMWFGYHVLFEVLGSGQTPGKRAAGIRVTMADGSGIGFVASSIRNIIRVIDLLPGVYLVGIVSILATTRNQRLGDLAAGSLVLRDRKAVAFTSRSPSMADLGPTAPPGAGFPSPAADSSPTPSPYQSWDVSLVTAEELATVRSFLLRRGELAPAARQQLGIELATRLHPKVVGPPDQEGPERFLEWIVAARDSR